MKKLGRVMLAVGALMLSATTASAGDCNCTSFPFLPDPPCTKICQAKLLSDGDPKVLERELGLDRKTVEKLVILRSQPDSPSSLGDFRAALSRGEFNEVSRGLGSLDGAKANRIIETFR